MVKFKVLSFALLAALLLASIGGGYYYYDKYQKTKMVLENPEEAAKVETQALLDKVGKLMELPSGEPTIATVLDKDKLQDQPFFAKAENGDKVLIFAESQTAVLYRPSTNKIIGFAPVSIGEPEGQQNADNGAVMEEVSPEPQATINPELEANP